MDTTLLIELKKLYSHKGASKCFAMAGCLSDEICVLRVEVGVQFIASFCFFPDYLRRSSIEPPLPPAIEAPTPTSSSVSNLPSLSPTV